MPTSLNLFDEALRIGAMELDALRASDVELADQYFEQRAALTEQALQLRDAPADVLSGRMLILQELQNALYAEAKKLKLEIQESLSVSRKQSQRMRGYGLAVRQAREL